MRTICAPFRSVFAEPRRRPEALAMVIIRAPKFPPSKEKFDRYG